MSHRRFSVFTCCFLIAFMTSFKVISLRCFKGAKAGIFTQSENQNSSNSYLTTQAPQPSFQDSYPMSPTTQPSLHDSYPMTQTPQPLLHDSYPMTPTTQPSLHDSYPMAPTPHASLQDSYPMTPTPQPSLQDSYPKTPTPQPSLHDFYPKTPTPQPSLQDSYSITPTSSQNLQLRLIVAGSGSLLVKLISFSNPTGVDSSGTCCDNFFRSSNCFDSCDHQFHLCFKKKPRDENCTLHEVATDSISSNIIEFGDRITNVTNPIRIKFQKWKGVFGLKITVSDHDDNVNDPIGEIDYIFKSNQRQKNENLTKDPFSISFRIEISCDINYYGTDCTTFCLPNDMCHCQEDTGELICPTLLTTTVVTTTTELIEPDVDNQFRSTNPDSSTSRMHSGSLTEFENDNDRLQETGNSGMAAPVEFDDSTTRSVVITTTQRHTVLEEQERTTVKTTPRPLQTRIPSTSTDGSTVILNCTHLIQFNYKVFQHKIKSYEDLNIFTIKLSIKDETVSIAYLLFNTIGSIFPPDKCLLEIVMLTQDLDVRNESKEILVKYVARFNGTGFYLPLSTEEMVLKPLSNYSAGTFYAPAKPIGQKMPIVSKRISRLVVIIIGSCALFVIFTLLMLGIYFLCQIKRGHYNLGRTYSYAIEDIKGMQETDTRINSAETSIELKDMQEDHHIIPYENGF